MTTMYLSGLSLASFQPSEWLNRDTLDGNKHFLTLFHSVAQLGQDLPSRSLIIPRMPAMLETRFPPNNAPSFNRRSPMGRLTTRVGAAGDEGEVKA